MNPLLLGFLTSGSLWLTCVLGRLCCRCGVCPNNCRRDGVEVLPPHYIAALFQLFALFLIWECWYSIWPSALPWTVWTSSGATAIVVFIGSYSAVPLAECMTCCCCQHSCPATCFIFWLQRKLLALELLLSDARRSFPGCAGAGDAGAGDAGAGDAGAGDAGADARAGDEDYARLANEKKKKKKKKGETKGEPKREPKEEDEQDEQPLPFGVTLATWTEIENQPRSLVHVSFMLALTYLLIFVAVMFSTNARKWNFDDDGIGFQYRELQVPAKYIGLSNQGIKWFITSSTCPNQTISYEPTNPMLPNLTIASDGTLFWDPTSSIAGTCTVNMTAHCRSWCDYHGFKITQPITFVVDPKLLRPFRIASSDPNPYRTGNYVAMRRDMNVSISVRYQPAWGNAIVSGALSVSETGVYTLGVSAPVKGIDRCPAARRITQIVSVNASVGVTNFFGDSVATWPEPELTSDRQGAVLLYDHEPFWCDNMTWVSSPTLPTLLSDDAAQIWLSILTPIMCIWALLMLCVYAAPHKYRRQQASALPHSSIQAGDDAADGAAVA